MQGSWSRFHWGISCLSVAAEKQHAQEVADTPDRHFFWLFHNADAKNLLPFHQASPCYSIFRTMDQQGFMGFCGALMVCFFLIDLSGRLVCVPGGFHCNGESQLNFPCLWTHAVTKKERNPKVQWILWNSLLQDASKARKAQKGIYIGV